MNKEYILKLLNSRLTPNRELIINGDEFLMWAAIYGYIDVVNQIPLVRNNVAAYNNSALKSAVQNGHI